MKFRGVPKVNLFLKIKPIWAQSAAFDSFYGISFGIFFLRPPELLVTPLPSLFTLSQLEKRVC
jgi:hypothetical protein